MYESGDYAIITQTSTGIVVTATGTDPNQDPQAKHSFTSDSKYTFGRWCNNELNKGNCLKAGKNGDTYWADIDHANTNCINKFK